MSDQIFYVYVYWDQVSGQPFYVGKGQGRRWKDHLSGKSHNKRLAAKVTQLLEAGTPPRVELVKTNLTNEVACAEEMALIAKWGRKGLDEGGILLNFTLGGEGVSGRVLPRETIERIAAKQRGIPRPHARAAVSAGTSAAMNTPEMRAYISSKRKGVPCPEITKQKLSEHFSAARKGAGNPAAKKWRVIDPTGKQFDVDDLVGFCNERCLSYVGLKAGFRHNRAVMKGKSAGWRLYQVE